MRLALLPEPLHPAQVGAVVFELFGSWFDVVGEARVRADLRRMKRLWQQCQPHPVVAAEAEVFA